MERQRNHRLDLVEVYDHRSVVKRAVFGSYGTVFSLPAVCGEIVAHLFVRAPHGRKAGALRRHHVYSVAVFDGQSVYALAHEFEHGVFDEPACESRPDERERNVLRTYALADFAFELDRHDLGIGDVVCTSEQLLDKLRTALTHRHSAERAVTGVAVAAEYHLPGAANISRI